MKSVYEPLSIVTGLLDSPKFRKQVDAYRLGSDIGKGSGKVYDGGIVIEEIQPARE